MQFLLSCIFSMLPCHSSGCLSVIVVITIPSPRFHYFVAKACTRHICAHQGLPSVLHSSHSPICMSSVINSIPIYCMVSFCGWNKSMHRSTFKHIKVLSCTLSLNIWNFALMLLIDLMTSSGIFPPTIFGAPFQLSYLGLVI